MKIAKISLILVAILYLSGCASGAKVENMTYQGAQKNYSEGLKLRSRVARKRIPCGLLKSVVTRFQRQLNKACPHKDYYLITDDIN